MKGTPTMSGAPLNPARLANLMATVAKSFPLELLTDEVCKSWEDNGAELARRLVFLAKLAPAPKRKGKKKMKSFDFSGFFVSTNRFSVDPEFIARFDVTSCEKDTRELSVKFVLPCNLSDSQNAKAVGGIDALLAMKPTLYQLSTELALALEGKSKLFTEGNHYLLYMEGCDRTLHPVYVDLRGESLELECYSFTTTVGSWVKDVRVCGN